jgi:hypothetical protein
MTFLVAIRACDGLARTLSLRLRTVLGSMTPLVAVETPTFMRWHALPSIVKTLQDFVHVLRPALTFTGPTGLVREPDRDSVLFVGIALQINICKGLLYLCLESDQKDTQPVVVETFLQAAIGDLRVLNQNRLDVFLEGDQKIIDVVILDSLFDIFPSPVN